MQTNRFETFLDAVLAIVITVLVLKLIQPDAATWGAVFSLNTRYLIYITCFIIIFNTWYNDHNLFQLVDEIDNKVVLVYGVLTFIITLIPYFATWVGLHPDSVAAQSMFGLLFLLTNIFYTFSTYLIVRANSYNEKLKRINLKDFKRYIPIIFILIGYLLTFTVYVYGVYVSCILSTVYWFVLNVMAKSEIESSERFEAFFDAIVAIILTIIVLEIPMAVNGSWESLFEIRLEFIAYAISFVVCFNYWNFNNNLFSIVNKIDGKVIWSLGLSMLVLSLIPYLTTFVASNFYSFVPQACYGIDFIIVAFLSILTSKALKKADGANIALMMMLTNSYFITTIIVVGIGLIIGYYFYPPAVIASCLISILMIWFWPLSKKYF